MRITMSHLILAAVGALGLAILGAVVTGRSFGPGRDYVECISRIYNLNDAISMYTMDYGRVMPADSWVSDVREYLGDHRDAFHCPNDDSHAFSSYGMNRMISGRSITELGQDTVTLYETAHPGDNPVGGPDDVVSPPRHRNGNMYTFAPQGVRQLATPPPFGP